MGPRVDVTEVRVPEGYTRGRGASMVGIWWIVQATLFRWSPRPAYGWRRWLLRAFGAQIGRNVRIRPGVRVEFPWRLTIGDHSTVGDDVWLYSLAEINVGRHCVVSQRSFLCTGSHDPDDPHMTLQVAPIVVGYGAWIASDVFVAPGVEIGDEAVIGARSSVFGSQPGGMVCYGSPCRPVRARRLPHPTGEDPREA